MSQGRRVLKSVVLALSFLCVWAWGGWLKGELIATGMSPSVALVAVTGLLLVEGLLLGILCACVWIEGPGGLEERGTMTRLLGMELSVVPMAECVGPKTVGPFYVESSKGNATYVVTFPRHSGDGTCTCPAFQYCKTMPRTCKHLDWVDRHERCAWSEQVWGGQTEPGVCPECAGETEHVMVAV